jgi:FMN phosphatase YigB (HAD superfamily)
LSYEHGWMKPDPKLYQVVERQSGQRGPAILYIDDRPENVEAGAQRGWQTILHVDPERSGSFVRKVCGLPPGGILPLSSSSRSPRSL